MRRLFLRLFLAVPVALVIGCHDGSHPAAPDSSVRPITANTPREVPRPPRFETATPKYPMAVQYIIYREFVNRHKDAARLIRQGDPYWQYVERRLLELYPGTGYRGMVRDAHVDMRRYRAAWAGYQTQLREYSTGDDPICPYWAPSADLVVASCGTYGDPNANPYGYDDDPSWSGQTEVEPDPYATPWRRRSTGSR